MAFISFSSFRGEKNTKQIMFDIGFYVGVQYCSLIPKWQSVSESKSSKASIPFSQQGPAAVRTRVWIGAVSHDEGHNCEIFGEGGRLIVAFQFSGCVSNICCCAVPEFLFAVHECF